MYKQVNTNIHLIRELLRKRTVKRVLHELIGRENLVLLVRKLEVPWCVALFRCYAHWKEYANLIWTSLDIPEKMKDGIKSRLDLVELNTTSELAPQVRQKKIFLPPACSTLCWAKKLSFCMIVKLRFPLDFFNIKGIIKNRN